MYSYKLWKYQCTFINIHQQEFANVIYNLLFRVIYMNDCDVQKYHKSKNTFQKYLYKTILFVSQIKNKTVIGSS